MAWQQNWNQVHNLTNAPPATQTTQTLTQLQMQSLTPEQIQQWQQWHIYQQQLAQWQTQYGEQYQREMQQKLLGVQSLPTQQSSQTVFLAGYNIPVAPPPAPVDPKPPLPPQPPDANKIPAASFHQPQQSHSREYTIKSTTDNNSNRSDRNELFSNSSSTPDLSTPDAQFDLEFKKWEEEFYRWKKQNEKHPDREAFAKYEKTFEECRRRLLERREQMRLKRDLSSVNDSSGPSKILKTNSLEITNMSSSTNLPMQKGPIEVNDLFTSSKPGGIPGLDLVIEKQTVNEKIDYIDEDMSEVIATVEEKSHKAGANVGNSIEIPTVTIPVDHTVTKPTEKVEDKPKSVLPDISVLSQGINNILDDPKLASLLSLVVGQTSGMQQTTYSGTVNDNQMVNTNNSGANIVSNASKSYSQNPGNPANNIEQEDLRPTDDNSLFSRRSLNELPKDNVKSILSNDNSDLFTSRNSMNDALQNSKNSENLNNNLVDDFEFFKPLKVIDYNHKTKFDQIVKFDRSFDDYFPMKIIEYGHTTAPNKRNRATRWNRDLLSNVRENLRKDYWIKRDPKVNEFPKMEQNKTVDKKYNENVNEDAKLRENNAPPEYLEEVSSGEEETILNEPFSSGLKDGSDISDDEFEEPVDTDKTDNNYSEPTKENRPKSIAELPIFDDAMPTIALTISIENLLCLPRRFNRPKRITIILRGPPGSGKTHIAKLIKDKEVEMGGSTPRILSIDDYFLVDEEDLEESKDCENNLENKKQKFEYDKEKEPMYLQCLMKSYKKTLSDGLFDFIIVDCVNSSLTTFNEFYHSAKSYGFTPFTVELLCDLETCLKQNVHNRSKEDIEEILSTWVKTPADYTLLDIEPLLKIKDDIPHIEETHETTQDDIEMENTEEMNEDSNKDNNEDESDEQSMNLTFGNLNSKWDNDTKDDKLARLDGINRSRKQTTMEDFLQCEDYFRDETPPKDGKKRVRWADIEEKRAQDKMRAVGFVVGQTDWNRMMDPTEGSSALTKTKYI